MSADNIIYVRRNQKVFEVWEQSASCDPEPSKAATTHPDLGAALVAAHALHEEYGLVEYGVEVRDEEPECCPTCKRPL